MLIATVCISTPERSGDWFYRTGMPMRAVASLPGVWTVDLPAIHALFPAVAEAADVLVVNMVTDDPVVAALEGRRKRGQLTVFELNDDPQDVWSAGPVEQDCYRRSLLHLPQWDAVQFSTEALRRRYDRRTEKPTAVFENAVMTTLHGAAGRPPKAAIGWGGSMRHLPDLEEIAPALLGWLDGRPGVRLEMMCDPRLCAPFCGLGDRLVHHEVGGMARYLSWLRTLDVGLAPLRLTRFNLARSAVKAMEYAACGAVPVVAELEPYWAIRHGHNGLTFASPDELVAGLEDLWNNPPEVWATLVSNAQRDLCQPLDPTERLDWWCGLAGGTAGGGGTLLDEWARHPSATLYERHLSLGFGPAEMDRWRKIVREQ